LKIDLKKPISQVLFYPMIYLLRRLQSNDGAPIVTTERVGIRGHLPSSRRWWWSDPPNLHHAGFTYRAYYYARPWALTSRFHPYPATHSAASL